MTGAPQVVVRLSLQKVWIFLCEKIGDDCHIKQVTILLLSRFIVPRVECVFRCKGCNCDNDGELEEEEKEDEDESSLSL